MTDIVSPAKRSQMMSGIRGKDTKPELLVRRALHAKGFRFRLHVKDLPGRPDIVLRKHQAVVLVHGCFWHGHDCRYFKPPSTRPEFWLAKIGRNRANDLRSEEHTSELQSLMRISYAVFCLKKKKTNILTTYKYTNK